MLTYPTTNNNNYKVRTEKVLLLCCYYRDSVRSIIEILEAIQRLSVFQVTVVNMYEHVGKDGRLALARHHDWTEFDAIIIHNTLAYDVDILAQIDSFQKVKLRDHTAVKILLKQDEHFKFRKTLEYITSNKFDCVFSLLPDTEWPKVYREAVNAGTKIRQMLTGYVTPDMRVFQYNPNRDIDIGYRGSVMPLAFGRLGYEKRKIGDDVKRLLSSSGRWRLDISSDWKDRLGGEDWLLFLRRCKTVLGVESGSGVFDLDGNLEEVCRNIEDQIGTYSDTETYAEEYLRRLASVDGAIRYYTIAPRHFEAIACGAVQIMFPGSYSGRLTPNRHYIELKRDYSNLPEIMERVADSDYLRNMAETAFHEVIMNPDNWIESFVREIDEEIDRGLEKKGHRHLRRFLSSEPTRTIIVMQAHDYGVDPRRDTWLPSFKAADLQFKLLCIGTQKTPTISTSEFATVLTFPVRTWDHAMTTKYANLLGIHDPLFSTINLLSTLILYDDTEMARFFGAPLHTPRLQVFRQILQYIMNTTASLLAALEKFSGHSLIIAVNLPTLLAARIARKLSGIEIFYEALEYWPEADPDSMQFEIDFWIGLERSLLSDVSYAQTVSPGLASLMSQLYARPFGYTPNATLRRDYLPPKSIDTVQNQKIRFYFHGNFSPHRGLEELIHVFEYTPENAVLVLKGPDSPFKARLQNTVRKSRRLRERIFFPPAVATADLVKSAHTEADVGIIPYLARGENYKHCSPNKLGQYLAASLPIIAHKTLFVSKVLAESKAGVAVDFCNTDSLLSAITEICRNPEKIIEFSQNASIYFQDHYNWEKVSQNFYDHLHRHIIVQSPRLFSVAEFSETSGYYPDHYVPPPLGERPSWWLYLSLKRIWGQVFPEWLRIVLRPILRTLKPLWQKD